MYNNIGTRLDGKNIFPASDIDFRQLDVLMMNAMLFLEVASYFWKSAAAGPETRRRTSRACKRWSSTNSTSASVQ